MVAAAEKQRPPLFAEAEAGDQIAVTVDVAVVEVPQLAAPLANELEQSTAGVEIVLIGFQMRRQVLDAFCEDRNLHLRGTGIRPMDGIVPNEFFLALGGQQPSFASSFAYRVNISKSSTRHV